MSDPLYDVSANSSDSSDLFPFSSQPEPSIQRLLTTVQQVAEQQKELCNTQKRMVEILEEHLIPSASPSPATLSASSSTSTTSDIRSASSTSTTSGVRMIEAVPSTVPSDAFVSPARVSISLAVAALQVGRDAPPPQVYVVNIPPINVAPAVSSSPPPLPCHRRRR